MHTEVFIIPYLDINWWSGLISLDTIYMRQWDKLEEAYLQHVPFKLLNFPTINNKIINKSS